jgi:polyvinyl alcohol dehydrogenase (cytochrome)
MGPSGASVWAAPTIDVEKRVIYVGTGDNHSAPATDTSDAVRALSLDDGKVVWSRQLLSGDMGNGACLSTDRTNCPEPHGPDYDLGGSANLVGLGGGKRILTIGQKSGMVWGLDPTKAGRSSGAAGSEPEDRSGGFNGARRRTERPSMSPFLTSGSAISSLGS